MSGRGIVQFIVKRASRLSNFIMSQETARVLSIQSHVVSGYVGNKSAVFPMQLLGIEVDFINSVQFSNHTGYKMFKGQILTENDLSDLIDGLNANDLDVYTHLLTGYIGSKSFLHQILNVVENLRKKNPNLIYVCDPVMGDNGRLYVPKELVPIYRDSVVKLANIITPNLFELQLLTDVKINNKQDIWEAVTILHSKGVETVVISSVEIPELPGFLCVFASRNTGGKDERYCMEIKKIPMSFTGSGDLFAALILSWMHKSNNDLKESLENTIASLHAILERTFESCKGLERNARNKELKLLQSKLDIEQPKIIFKANIVP